MKDDNYNPILDDDDADDKLVFGLSDAGGSNESDDVTPKSKPWERERTDQENDDLMRRAAAGELLPGRKRRPSAYSRRDVTENDLHLLAFLAHFKYSTDGPLATFADVQRRTVYRRMMGLREMKLVHRVDVPGARRLWLVSDKGRRTLEDAQYINQGDVRRIRPDEVTLDQMGHNLAIAQTAAWLTRGMPDAHSMARWLDVPYSLNVLTSEFAIRQGWESLIYDNKDKLGKRATDGTKAYTRGGIGAKNREQQLNRAKAGELAYSDLFAQSPSLWTLSNARHAEENTKEFHYPDLVLNRESARDSSKPQSIAFEIELSVKNKGELAKIMRMYKEDRTTYAGSVWVVSSPSVKRHVEAVVEQVEGSDRVIIVPLFDSFGDEHCGLPWKL